MSELSTRIRSQVEFYLGDANMPRDKFLREQASKDADGWISLETVASFQRMKALTTDMDAVKEAVKQAESAVFEVDEEALNIRRKSPLPEAADLMPRSIYVKGFSQSASLDELLSFFQEHNVEAIRMRRFPKSKDFKGSVFVEFKTVADSQAFISSLPLEYQGNELIVMTKLAYFESKNAGGSKANVEEEFEKLATEYTKGCLVKLAGVPVNSKHHIVKQALAEVLDCEVAFVEQQQDNAVFARLKEAKAAELVEAITEKGMKIEDAVITASVPSEEEEAKYYRNLAAVMISKRSSVKYGKNQGKGGYKKKGFGNNKKRGAQGDEASEAKQAKESYNDDHHENDQTNGDDN